MSNSTEHTGNEHLNSFEIDYASGLPVWVQIKNRISYLIGSGFYAPGDKLPTVRALAVTLDISYNTVNRAYMDLERDGYITTRKGRGTFVADPPAASRQHGGESPIELIIDDMLLACSKAGLVDADILTLVQQRMARRKK